MKKLNLSHRTGQNGLCTNIIDCLGTGEDLWGSAGDQTLGELPFNLLLELSDVSKQIC